MGIELKQAACSYFSCDCDGANADKVADYFTIKAIPLEVDFN